MFAPGSSTTTNTNQQYNIHVQAAETPYASIPSEDTNTICSSNARAAEYAAEESRQALSQNKRYGMLFEYYSLEPSQDMQPSNIEIPSKASSDILSPTTPSSPLSQYMAPPLKWRKSFTWKLRVAVRKRVSRRTSTHPPSCGVSFSPSCWKHPEPKRAGAFDTSDIHSRGEDQTSSRILSRSKPIETFDCDSSYSLVESHGIDRTPQKPGRLALAASRESPSAKKAFDSHKRQNSKSVRSPVEELGVESGLDDLQSDILNDILFSVRSSPSARAVVRCKL